MKRHNAYGPYGGIAFKALRHTPFLYLFLADAFQFL